MADKLLQFKISRPALEAKRDMLKIDGVEIVGDSGKLKKKGIELRYEYQEPILTLEVLSKPFFISFAKIEKELTNWFTI